MKTKLFSRAVICAAFATPLLVSISETRAATNSPLDADANHSSLPVERIEQIIGIKGMVDNGVLDLELSRDDIGTVRGTQGVSFDGSFELNGDLFFQPLSNGRAFLNGDIPLKEEEVNPFVSTLLKNGLVFQAFHQHLPMHPQVWFVHFRGTGDPVVLAKAIRGAINVTSTQLPQMPPKNPTTPLDPKLLEKILHGHASVGDNGVVTVWVYRKNRVEIDEVNVNPQANISTNIEFRPTGGSNADVVSDFSMTSDEVNRVVERMLNHLGWYQGCLYNQETDEEPQLFFDHMLKSGDAYQLAREIRQGLDLTQSE